MGGRCEKLDEFFQAWRGTVVMKRLAASSPYWEMTLRGRTCREVFGPQPQCRPNRSKSRCSGRNPKPSRVVGVSRGETATVRNLIGDFFNAQ